MNAKENALLAFIIAAEKQALSFRAYMARDDIDTLDILLRDSREYMDALERLYAEMKKL